MTEQTYLYYWHHDVWQVLASWVALATVLALIGGALWNGGYNSALRSIPQADGYDTVNSRPAPPPIQRPQSKAGKRRFLAPASDAFPGIRTSFSRSRNDAA